MEHKRDTGIINYNLIILLKHSFVTQLYLQAFTKCLKKLIGFVLLANLVTTFRLSAQAHNRRSREN